MKLQVVQPWYHEGLSFGCTQCGNCCTGGPGYVWISEEEIGRLAGFLKISPEETVEKYCRKLSGGISLQERRSAAGLYDCVFLKADSQGRRTCSVYEVRPLQCRTWPFWTGNLADKESWERAGNRCPGIGKGKSYSQKQIEGLRDASDWPQNP